MADEGEGWERMGGWSTLYGGKEKECLYLAFMHDQPGGHAEALLNTYSGSAATYTLATE